MKRLVVLLLVLVGLAAFAFSGGVAGALPPEYYGQFGWAEEPALRPYKWMWVGVKAFFFQTREGFVRGNMNMPVVGSVETIRGVRRGAIDMAEHTWSGALYRSVPPRGFHRIQGRWNNALESDLLLRNAPDLITSALVWKWYAWPVQKVVDHYPLESDEKVQIRLDYARQEMEARRLAEAIRREQRVGRDLSTVERAQRRYLQSTGRHGRRVVPDPYYLPDYRGDLLRLGR